MVKVAGWVRACVPGGLPCARGKSRTQIQLPAVCFTAGQYPVSLISSICVVK